MHLVHQLGKKQSNFVPTLLSLRSVQKKNTNLKWTEEQKKIVIHCQKIEIKYFNPNLKAIRKTYASWKGFGAALRLAFSLFNRREI